MKKVRLTIPIEIEVWIEEDAIVQMPGADTTKAEIRLSSRARHGCVKALEARGRIAPERAPLYANEIAMLSAKEIMATAYVGKTSLAEIERKLAELNLKLQDDA